MPAAEPNIDACLSGVTLYRGERRVLSGIHWNIRSGQRWVLVGGNGSGKTQLLKVVAGIVRPTSASQRALRWRLAGEWHQVPYEIKPHVAYVGPERQDKYQRYAWDMAAEDVVATGIYGTDITLDVPAPPERRRVSALLRRLGIASLAGRGFLELSYGEQRMTLLARALIARPKLLLLDEVFTGLDGDNHARLMRWLTRLRSAMPLVLATHQLSDVPSSATHALVLQKGRVVYCGGLRGAPLARYLAGSAGGHPGARPVKRGRPDLSKHPAAPLVRLCRACVYLEERCALSEVSLSVRAGEFWVIHGPNGAGKTTLLRTLYGDHGVAAGGLVERSGIRPGVPLECFRHRTGMTAPYLHARYPRLVTVGEVVLSGRYGSIGVQRTPTRADRAATLRALRRLNLTDWARRPLGELSYGQTRLVLLARAVVREPRLLLLDEPLESVDAGARSILSREVLRMAARGAAIVVTAHSRLEWTRYATHEIELKSGRVEYCGMTRTAHYDP